MLSRDKITVREVFDRIKLIKGVKKDKAVAALLGVRPGTLAGQLSRDTIPYQEIIMFCDREGISLDMVLLGAQTDRVAGKTPRYILPGGSTASGDQAFDRLRTIIQQIQTSTKDLNLVLPEFVVAKILELSSTHHMSDEAIEDVLKLLAWGMRSGSIVEGELGDRAP